VFGAIFPARDVALCILAFTVSLFLLLDNVFDAFRSRLAGWGRKESAFVEIGSAVVWRSRSTVRPPLIREPSTVTCLVEGPRYIPSQSLLSLALRKAAELNLVTFGNGLAAGRGIERKRTI